ncbi:MAG: 16S rRNA (guanine(966)-N(2))-methyltransferase RsmD [Thermoleophilaceae bacterium]
MRIVAGESKGRRLRAPAGRATRPTADRVREALFSILGPVEGLRVLDLFAGSGALGIEALSRGADTAVFVDSDRRAVRAVRGNLDAAGMDGRADVVRADALRYLSRARAAGCSFGLILLDPPYDAARRLAEPLAQRLPDLLSDDARIVTESDKRDPLLLELPLELERTYGDTRIAVHRGP